jgi:hypothetical protein
MNSRTRHSTHEVATSEHCILVFDATNSLSEVRRAMSLKGNKRAPKYAQRSICAKAGSPKRRESAPCRARWYPWRSQEEQGGMFLGQRLTFILKGMREQEHADNAVIN